jgi:hypothetical protein
MLATCASLCARAAPCTLQDVLLWLQGNGSNAPMGYAELSSQRRTRTTLGLLPMTLPLLLVAIWLLSHAATAQPDVISCGGFVSVSAQVQAHLKDVGVGSLDLSSVQVQLLSPQGLKKSEGDCSPNGYYFVSVYRQRLQLHRVLTP